MWQEVNAKCEHAGMMRCFWSGVKPSGLGTNSDARTGNPRRAKLACGGKMYTIHRKCLPTYYKAKTGGDKH